MECGRYGVDGLLARRHVMQGRSKGPALVQVQNLSIQAETVMEEIKKQMAVIGILVRFTVSQVLIRHMKLNGRLSFK